MHQTLLLHLLAEVVVELIAMAVALVDLGLAVAAAAIWVPAADDAGVRAQAHGAALGNVALLVGHEVDDIMFAVGSEFAGVGIGIAQHIAGKLHDRDLHTQADAEVGDTVLAGIAGGLDHALDAAVTEAAGNDDAVARRPDSLGAASAGQSGLRLSTQSMSTLALVLIARVVQRSPRRER